MSKPTAVYRLYDEAGVLLYVGISGNPQSRFRQHAADKDWWSEVDHARIEWLECRSLASIEEQRAIEDEGPRHNAALPLWRVPDPDVIFELPVEERGSALAAMRERREDLARTHAALVDGVRDALAAGRSPDHVARYSGWSPTHIAKIRDGRTGRRQHQD